MSLDSNIRSNDQALLYLTGLGARVAAESGRAADRQHLGKLLLRSLRDDPAFLHQIDGATDERETAGSVLARSVLCARALRRLGAGVGDVAAILAPNYINTAVPYYASLYIGMAICPLDHNFTCEELQAHLALARPRVVFCASGAAAQVRAALAAAGRPAELVLLDAAAGGLDDFLRAAGPNTEEDVALFRATDFDPEETLAFLLPTSGTTGAPKVTASTHKNSLLGLPSLYQYYVQFPSPTAMILLLSPLQWLTASFAFLSGPLYRITRLQTSAPVDKDHCYELINKYRPTWTALGPALLGALVTAADRGRCDFTSLDTVVTGGNFVTVELGQAVKEVSPRTLVRAAYGLSESNNLVFLSGDPAPVWPLGRPGALLQLRLVDTTTLEDIHEPHVTGELWLKGDTIFKGYHGLPAETAAVFAPGGWFRTGDTFYRDEADRFFFVERMKLLMKYQSQWVSPTELEQVISALRGVAAAAVSSVSDAAAGDLPVAFVVRRAQHRLTAQEVKDHVKEKMADWNQLRGGVIFIDQIPRTPTSKVHRRRLKELAQTMPRE